MPPSPLTISPKTSRPGLWGLLNLWFTLYRMREANQAGANHLIIEAGEHYAKKWKGNARFYTLLSAAQWAASHWRKCIHSGRRSLAIKPNQPKTVIFLLSAFR